MIGSLPRLTRTGGLVGTPEYMAPEQAEGESAGPAADRYALAVVAYEMLTGAVPYSADTPLATLLAHLHKPLPLPRERNPELAPQVEAVLLKGLAKRPEDRYPRARDLVRALEAAVGSPAAASTAAVLPPPAQAASLQPDAAAAAALGNGGVTSPMAVTPPTGGTRLLSRLVVRLAAVVAVVLLAAGGALAFTRSVSPPGAAATAPPVASAARALPVAEHAIPRKGALVFEAKLDGTPGGDLRLPRSITAGDAADSDIRFSPGAIEAVVLRAGGGTAAAFNMPARSPTSASLTSP